MAYIVSCILAIVAEIIFYKQEPNVIPSLALSVLGVFYIGMLIGVITLLRFVSDDQWKSLPLISLILTVKMGDIGAYTVGRLIGKHRFRSSTQPWKNNGGSLGRTIVFSWRSVFPHSVCYLIGSIFNRPSFPGGK